MEKQNITLKCEKREVIGKKVKSLRKLEKLPGILYGKEQKNVPLLFDTKKFNTAFLQAGTSTIVNIKIENEDSIRKVLLHEPQLHPVTGFPIHVDVYQVNMKEKIRTEIPLQFIGEPPAVNELEGNLITNRDNVEVECLPHDLVSEITVDISNLKTFDDKIHVKDLPVNEGIEILDEPDELIVYVTEPRSEEELEAELTPTTAEEEATKIEELKGDEAKTEDTEVQETEKNPQNNE